MRITALISFFLLFALTTQSQTTIFNGSFSIREITGSSPSYTVDGFFQSEGTYIGTDIQEGDRIYFWHGNDCDYLVVDTVYYAYANIVNLGLSDPDTAFLSIPTGKGLMTRLTDYYNFSIPFTADVPDVLKKCVGGKLINEIDQIRPQTSFYADSIFLDTTGLTYINDTVLQVALEQIDSALFDINDSLDSIPRGSGTANQWAYWLDANTLTTSNYIVRDATRLTLNAPVRLQNLATVSLPGVPQSGDVVMNTTENELWAYRNSSWDAIAYWRKSGSNIYYTNGTAAVGTTGGSAMFTVRETATSNLFRMENAAGTLGMSFRSDGLFQLGNRGLTIAPITGAYNGVNISGHTMAFFPANNSNTTTLGSFAFVDYGYSTYSANTKTVRITHYPSNPFAQASGAQTYTALEVTPSINQTGTATGTITGIDYTPTLTAILGTHYGILIRPTGAKNGFGTGTPSATVDIVGDLEVSSRTGTATALAGWAADNKSADIAIGSGLSFSSGTLSATGSYTGFTPAADNGAGDDIESGDILTIEGDVDIETEITSQTISIRNKWNPALIFYVSAFGDDATGQRGNPQRPFLNFSTAVDSCEAVSGSWIYVNDGAHTFTSAGDTLTGLNVFIDAAATLAARVQSGLFYAEGKFTVTYRPQSSSNLTQIYGNHVVLGMDMTLGGSIEVDAGIIEVSSGGDFAGTSTKNVRFNSNILLQQEVGEFGGDMSSLNYAAQCNILRSNSAALFAFGDGSTTTAMNDNRVSLKANRSEMGSTIGLFFIDIPADGSFARNKINIEINEWTKAGQIISTSANVRQLATNGSSSLINVHLGSFHSTVTSGTDVIGISTTSKDDQFLTPFIISGHIMSDSLPVLAVTGTLGIGFQFENTTLEVRKAGVNVVDIATLNTSSTYLLSFTNSNLRNDGSTAKIDITTATTIPQGNYYDLNSSYNVFLDYGNNNRSADDLSKTRSGLVLAPATDGTVYETGGVLFTQTAIDTVTNTASETSLINTGKGSVTLPANYLEEGRDIKCEAWGTVTTNGSPPSLELNLKLGSTAVWDSGSFSMIDLSAGIETWYANISFTTYTEGVSGTVMPAGEFSFFVGGDPSFGKVIRPVYASPVTINTTTSQTIDFTATWGSADVNASIVMTKFICKAQN